MLRTLQVAVLGPPVAGLAAQPKFVRLQAHLLRLSLVARPAAAVARAGTGDPGGAARHLPPEWGAMLLGTSTAQEAHAWEAALSRARNFAAAIHRHC